MLRKWIKNRKNLLVSLPNSSRRSKAASMLRASSAEDVEVEGMALEDMELEAPDLEDMDAIPAGGLSERP